MSPVPSSFKETLQQWIAAIVSHNCLITRDVSIRNNACSNCAESNRAVRRTRKVHITMCTRVYGMVLYGGNIAQQGIWYVGMGILQYELGNKINLDFFVRSRWVIDGNWRSFHISLSCTICWESGLVLRLSERWLWHSYPMKVVLVLVKYLYEQPEFYTGQTNIS